MWRKPELDYISGWNEKLDSWLKDIGVTEIPRSKEGAEWKKKVEIQLA